MGLFSDQEGLPQTDHRLGTPKRFRDCFLKKPMIKIAKGPDQVSLKKIQTTKVARGLDQVLTPKSGDLKKTGPKFGLQTHFGWWTLNTHQGCEVVGDSQRLARYLSETRTNKHSETSASGKQPIQPHFFTRNKYHLKLVLQ